MIAFTGSIFSWSYLDDDKISIFAMLSSVILSFKISNLFIDGTLTKTNHFVSSTNEIITSTDVIRNSAASNLFEFFAIFSFLIFILQLITSIRERGGDSDETE